MDIIDVIHFPKSKIALFQGVTNPIETVTDECDLQQKHREILLRDADSLVERKTQSGCVSEISIVDNILDGDEYQGVLREFSSLTSGAGVVTCVAQRLDVCVGETIIFYDDGGFSELSILDRESSGLQINEEDIEEFGYIGWIVR